jgi:hypothetical protein
VPPHPADNPGASVGELLHLGANFVISLKPASRKDTRPVETLRSLRQIGSVLQVAYFDIWGAKLAHSLSVA